MRQSGAKAALTAAHAGKVVSAAGFRPHIFFTQR